MLISLLGRKPDGTSEFSFYSFRSALETPSNSDRSPSFQDWLCCAFPDRRIKVLEHPTVDLQKVPQTTLTAIRAAVLPLLAPKRSVIIVDSGGVTRTFQVCKYLDLVEDGIRW